MYALQPTPHLTPEANVKHDLLAERVGTDADTIVITSASSKTAIGLAHLLSTHKVRPYHIVGLTSALNLDFVRGTRVYDRVLAYDDRDILTSGSIVVADFSGNSALIRKLQDTLGNRAVFFYLIGYTHWDRRSWTWSRMKKSDAFLRARPDPQASARMGYWRI
jgi:hypothetical protein